MYAHQHNLTVLTVTSCNIEYLLRLGIHAHQWYQCITSTVSCCRMCAWVREKVVQDSNCDATIADLNSVGLKVQHQNGCKDVLGTRPPLLSHLAKSCQGFQEYIYSKYALLCCTRICKFATCGLKSPFLYLCPKFHSYRLNVLFCTFVTSWVIFNKFHVIKNDPTNIHVYGKEVMRLNWDFGHE